MQSGFFSVVTAKCPVGKKVIGGGGEAQPVSGGSYYDDLALVDSYPITDTSWQAVASEVNPTTGQWRVLAYAICADVAS